MQFYPNPNYFRCVDVSAYICCLSKQCDVYVQKASHDHNKGQSRHLAFSRQITFFGSSRFNDLDLDGTRNVCVSYTLLSGFAAHKLLFCL